MNALAVSSHATGNIHIDASLRLLHFPVTAIVYIPAPICVFLRLTRSEFPSYTDMHAHVQSTSVEDPLHAKLGTAIAEDPSQSISLIPPEILSYIFQKHCDIDHESQSDDNTQASIRVSHVSKTWRDVALSTPMLWTTIVSSPAHLKDFYDTVLLRSKQSLLDVTITLTDDDAASSKAVESADMLYHHRPTRPPSPYTQHIGHRQFSLSTYPCHSYNICSSYDAACTQEFHGWYAHPPR